MGKAEIHSPPKEKPMEIHRVILKMFPNDIAKELEKIPASESEKITSLTDFNKSMRESDFVCEVAAPTLLFKPNESLLNEVNAEWVKIVSVYTSDKMLLRLTLISTVTLHNAKQSWLRPSVFIKK